MYKHTVIYTSVREIMDLAHKASNQVPKGAEIELISQGCTETDDIDDELRIETKSVEVVLNRPRKVNK